MKIKEFVCSVAITTALGLGTASSTQAQATLKPEQLLEMFRIGASDLSPSGKLVVYSLTSPNISSNSSTSVIYRINFDGSHRRLISNGNEHAYAPRFINDGKRIAYLSLKDGEMQVFSMNEEGEDIIQLTDIEGGISDFKISPNGKHLLYVKEIKNFETAGDLHPDLPQATGKVINDLMYKHWDEWVETIPRIFYTSLDNKNGIIKGGVDILGDEPYEAPMKPAVSMGDVNFSPDGRYIVYASRKKVGVAYTISTNSDIYLYDTKEKTTRNLTEGMMGYDTDPVFSPDGKQLAWVSMERDGYEADLRRLFVMDMKSGKKTYLTEGFECDVESPTWSGNDEIYFLSCVKAETHLHKIQVRSKKITQITEGQYNYTSFALAGKHILAGRQSMKVPTDLYQINPRNGEAKAITQENAELLKKIGDINVEKRWVKTTNGEQMLVWVIYPPHFDKTKKYPALLYCQGGPQSPVSQFFSYRWNFRIMAEQGYIVIAPNRHGVPSFGKAWNEQISGDYSGQNIQDYLSAVDEVSKEPYVDKEHIACVGASYGGYSAYYLASHHNGRFATFIAHAGIFNMEMQYLTTDEMWFANWDMGGAYWEKDNATAQRTFAHSPHKFVDQWDKPILVIHGEKDFRILAGQGMAAFNAAKLRGIPAQMLIFPDEGHWILQPQNALLWQRTYFAWLDKWLKPKK